jgi:hypothetical protein
LIFAGDFENDYSTCGLFVQHSSVLLVCNYGLGSQTVIDYHYGDAFTTHGAPDKVDMLFCGSWLTDTRRGIYCITFDYPAWDYGSLTESRIIIEISQV